MTRQPILMVQEQTDSDGDIVFSISMQAVTHSRTMLDRLAKEFDVKLEFVRE